jgi:hypothetical protein
MRSLISVFYASSVCVAVVALVGCTGGGSQLAPPGTPSGVATDSQSGLGNCQLFPNSGSFYAPYNVNISRYPVNANSANYMATYRGHLHANFGYAPNTGIPINIVPRNQPFVPITFTKYPGESDPGPYPIPDNARLEGENGGSDHHLIVLRQGTCEDYEMFQAAHSRRGGWTAANGAKFNLKTGNRRHLFWTSADAAGTPIIAGLIRCDETANGSIDHAMNLVIAEPTQHGFIYPGTHWNTRFTNPDYLPMGARLRIKTSYNLSRFTGQALIIARAGKQYGFIVMDGAPRHFQLEGETGKCWNAQELAQLNAIPVSALEVLETGNVITAR